MQIRHSTGKVYEAISFVGESAGQVRVVCHDEAGNIQVFPVKLVKVVTGDRVIGGQASPIDAVNDDTDYDASDEYDQLQRDEAKASAKQKEKGK
jgi:hypothetical protein